MSISTLKRWVTEIADLTDPKEIVWCDGSEKQASEINRLLVSQGTFTALNPKIRPNSFIARTDPRDVARVESKTFICSNQESDAGPTNNWMDPVEMRAELREKFTGSMRGRTMYVIPFSMGPLNSKLARFGVEITDSPYVVASMMIMTRVSERVLKMISEGADWVPAIHSVGMPLIGANGESIQDVSWPCNPDEVRVVHFPETQEIWSYGSGYGGNSLLGKKAMSLRIGSVVAREQGWLAEHMLLIRVTAPNNKRYHIAGAFPSACGKTNLAMLQSELPGWKVETLGDDIVWMAPDSNGAMRAINPENGLFGVAPGTGMKTNRAAVESMREGVIFTNVATTESGDVWWEGLTKEPPENLIDWQGNPWDPSSNQPAAHPNSRFCFPIDQTQTLCPDWANPEGVTLDAILFGGRRAKDVPLVLKSRSWSHGVFLGASMSSEQTAAAEGEVGLLRRDPFAMLPFCGYNIADYFAHWLSFGKKQDAINLPAIYQVNWFRKNSAGEFVWPGFSDNLRVIKWIVEELEGVHAARETPLGLIPGPGQLDIETASIAEAELESLLSVDSDRWKIETEEIEKFFLTFGERLPDELISELRSLQNRLASMET